MTRSLTENCPAKRIFERRIKFLNREAGEKSQAAQIDRQNRNTARRSFPSRCQQRAIAAKHQQQVRFIRHVLARVFPFAIRARMPPFLSS